MSNEVIREDRYIVFKLSDVAEHLTTTEVLHLERLYEIQRVGRKEAGKSELECVVVESDWPEYEGDMPGFIEALRALKADPWPTIANGMITPDGWKLVPIEPTPTMITAALESSHAINVHRAERCYRAMLAAAPEAKP